MKEKIHPTYYSAATITCSCGNAFQTGSTVENIAVEVCSQCHPFFTGKQKILDTARRVEKYEERVKRKEETQGTHKHLSKKAKRAAKTVEKQTTIKTAKAEAKAALKAARASLSGE